MRHLPLAHSKNGRGERHGLVEHLRGVSTLATAFAQPLGASKLACYLGLWHDLGKLDPDFQRYLLACEREPRRRGRGPDHKAAGSILAGRHLGPLALAVQGHHGGLGTPSDLKAWLAERNRSPKVEDALARARELIPDLEPNDPVTLPQGLDEPSTAELFIRLAFSALVDADYLDTERHFEPERAGIREAKTDLATLWDRFRADQEGLISTPRGRVDQIRTGIYETCVAAAEQPPGLFSLTVPTGGGKTRSAMAFALAHAAKHGHVRVIVAVPFISITEQTADVYRSIFEAPGSEESQVLEHHSGWDPAAVADASDEDFHAQEIWTRLAAENWDAPVVVTTTVQLFESLFASRPSRCRKLHRLARSVIVLDEAQTLPATLLSPILDALRELCERYGSTVVISTATQPAFEAIPAFRELRAVEIAPDPATLFAQLKRVEYEWRIDPAVSWVEAAEVMRAVPQALAVLNTKKDALALLDALDDSNALHLSTLLCGKHRSSVIEDVKERLAGGRACRLVTTQVVEAGVDLDFPLVLRALGPLDSIIQAAGRCNREGKLDRGRVVVFKPAEGGMPGGSYRTGTEIALSMLNEHIGNLDEPDVPRAYFTSLFQTLDTDARGIQARRAALDFPEVARRFRMIEDETASVVVDYGSADDRREVRRLLDRLRGGAPDARFVLRRLQPYMVSVRRREADRYERQGLISWVVPGVGEWMGGYDGVKGLTTIDRDPEALVI